VQGGTVLKNRFISHTLSRGGSTGETGRSGGVCLPPVWDFCSAKDQKRSEGDVRGLEKKDRRRGNNGPGGELTVHEGGGGCWAGEKTVDVSEGSVQKEDKLSRGYCVTEDLMRRAEKKDLELD